MAGRRPGQRAADVGRARPLDPTALTAPRPDQGAGRAAPRRSTGLPSRPLKHRDELKHLVGEEYYRRFRTYLKLVRKMAGLGTMTMDIVALFKV